MAYEVFTFNPYTRAWEEALQSADAEAEERAHRLSAPGLGTRLVALVSDDAEKSPVYFYLGVKLALTLPHPISDTTDAQQFLAGIPADIVHRYTQSGIGLRDLLREVVEDISHDMSEVYPADILNPDIIEMAGGAASFDVVLTNPFDDRK